MSEILAGGRYLLLTKPLHLLIISLPIQIIPSKTQKLYFSLFFKHLCQVADFIDFGTCNQLTVNIVWTQINWPQSSAFFFSPCNVNVSCHLCYCTYSVWLCCVFPVHVCFLKLNFDELSPNIGSSVICTVAVVYTGDTGVWYILRNGRHKTDTMEQQIFHWQQLLLTSLPHISC